MIVELTRSSEWVVPQAVANPQVQQFGAKLFLAGWGQGKGLVMRWSPLTGFIIGNKGRKMAFFS